MSIKYFKEFDDIDTLLYGNCDVFAKKLHTELNKLKIKNDYYSYLDYDYDIESVVLCHIFIRLQNGVYLDANGMYEEGDLSRYMYDNYEELEGWETVVGLDSPVIKKNINRKIDKETREIVNKRVKEVITEIKKSLNKNKKVINFIKPKQVKVTQVSVEKFIDSLRKAIKSGEDICNIKVGLVKNNNKYDLLAVPKTYKFNVRTMELGFLHNKLESININGNKKKLSKYLTEFINKTLEGVRDNVLINYNIEDMFGYDYIDNKDLAKKHCFLSSIDVGNKTFLYIENFSVYTNLYGYSKLDKNKKDIAKLYLINGCDRQGNVIDMNLLYYNIYEMSNIIDEVGNKKDIDILIKEYKNYIGDNIEYNYGKFLVQCTNFL